MSHSVECKDEYYCIWGKYLCSLFLWTKGLSVQGGKNSPFATGGERKPFEGLQQASGTEFTQISWESNPGRLVQSHLLCKCTILADSGMCMTDEAMRLSMQLVR